MKMKTTFLTAFVLLLLFTTLVQAQNPTFLWAKQIGGIGSQSSSSSNSIATDVNGGVFTSGRFSGTVDFDPGATTMNLTAIGFDNVFIQKLDASGNFQWAKQLSALTFINCFSISTDALRNVYATGQFSGTVDFNPGTAIVNLTSNSNDMFLLKLDASGNFQWAIKIGGMGNEKKE